MFLKISQNLQENTCEFYEIFENTYFQEHLRTAGKSFCKRSGWSLLSLTLSWRRLLSYRNQSSISQSNDFSKLVGQLLQASICKSHRKINWKASKIGKITIKNLLWSSFIVKVREVCFRRFQGKNFANFAQPHDVFQSDMQLQSWKVLAIP